MRTSAVLVLMTAPTARESRRLADVLVAERLAACVNVLGGLKSFYRWRGKTERASEFLLLAKTTRARLPALTKRVEALHPYDVPEILALPAFGGSVPYLSWISRETRASKRS